MAKQRIRIRMKAFDHKILDQSARQIVGDRPADRGRRLRPRCAAADGEERFTVIRSPFIDKDSQEHFEMRTHNRLIDVLDPTPKTVDALMRLTSRLALTSRSSSDPSPSPEGPPPPTPPFSRRLGRESWQCLRDIRAQGGDDLGLRRDRAGHPGHRHPGRAVLGDPGEDPGDGRLRRRADWVRGGARKLNSPEQATWQRHPHAAPPPPVAVPTPEYQVGQRLDVSMFEPGELVTLIGTSRGKGFQGVVKRHGFARWPQDPRAVGPLARARLHRLRHHPGRVLKGLRMAGKMGNDRVTVKNLLVVRADPERNLLLVRGAVPGPPRSLVRVVPRDSVVPEVAPEGDALRRERRTYSLPPPPPDNRPLDPALSSAGTQCAARCTRRWCAQLANARKGTHDTKHTGRGRRHHQEVWRQRAPGAPGRAPEGPHWRQGEVAFGPHPASTGRTSPARCGRGTTLGALGEGQAGEMVVLRADLSGAAQHQGRAPTD